MIDVRRSPSETSRSVPACPAIRPPLLKGTDLIKLGMKPGKAMGVLLAEIRENQLADELKNRREALAWAKKRLKTNVDAT